MHISSIQISGKKREDNLIEVKTRHHIYRNHEQEYSNVNELCPLIRFVVCTVQHLMRPNQDSKV